MSEFGKWEPIETAQKGEPGAYASGPAILGCLVGGWGSAQQIVRFSWHKDGAKGAWKGSYGRWEPTHWMPLPPPPTE